MRFHRLRQQTFDVLRRRMIRETEVALLHLLRCGDEARRIPTVEAGRGVFHPSFAAQYWSDRLGLD